MKAPAGWLALLFAAAGLAACGGGSSTNTGGGGGGGGTTPVNNTVTVVTNLGVNNNYVDGLFASVTVCVPGTSNCQTINNVLVDTGSYGLRLLASQLTLPLTINQDASGNPLGECEQFASSFNWGPVASADVQLAGEKASAVPIQIMGDPNFPAAPGGCTSSGLPEQDTQADLGANGILGVGVFADDCGPGCAPPQTAIPAVYFSCPNSGCVPTLVAEANQVTNPVARFAQDNNGVVIAMPSVGVLGAPTATGSMMFGIGTQSDNALNGAHGLAADGFGNFATSFQGTLFSGSVLDSGSNGNFFLDDTTLGLALCPDGDSGFYCPTATANFSATNQSASGTGTATAVWSVANAETLFNTGNAAFNNLAGPNPGGFDFGLAFFLGRTVFVGLDGTTAGALTGPFYAY